MLLAVDTLRNVYITALLLLIQHLISSRAILHYNIPEERPSGFLIAHIKTDAELKEGYTPPPVATQLAILPGAFSQYFSVHPDTGSLRVSSHSIDRDHLCGSVTTCVLALEVAVTVPVEHFRVFSVHVTIDDINDNAPAFPAAERHRYVTSVLESADLETLLEGIPIAKDTDIGKNGIQSYSLQTQGNSNGTFLLRVTEDFEGTLLPVLVVNNALDREVVDSYNLTLVAYDGGVPPKSGTLKIRVNVIDVNDNVPEFTSTLYNTSIREDAPAGTVLIRIIAKDSDTGRNAELEYSFSASTRDQYGHLFTINHTSGDVKLVRKFDSSYLDVYGLTVVAKDGGLPQKMAVSKLNIHVLGVNSYPPNISVNAVATVSRKPEIAEGLPIRSFVGFISVSDADKGVNAVVDCSVKREEDFSLELVHVNTYKLISMRIFDREKESRVGANVVCKDAGVPSLTSSAQFDVIIIDVNDNVPIFEHNMYEATVIENSDVGVILLQVAAQDADVEANAKIRYSLAEYTDDSTSGNRVMDSGFRSRWLSIDPESGVISTSARFDHESMSSYRVWLIAEDSGQPLSLNATALLTIRVDNENDCPPIFSQSSFSFGIFENLPAGLEVGTVSATDMDAPPYNQVLYNLFDPETSSIHSLFTVDGISGRITTTTSLNREEMAVYQIRAVAIDAKNSSLASTASVTIYIADKNDNAPVIHFPTEDNNTIEVSTHAPRGFLICRILAQDMDIGINAKIRFSIKQEELPDDMTSASLFGIDANNGAVFVNGRLDDVPVGNDLRMIVEASDQGSPRLTSTAVLYIRLNDSEALAAEMYLLAARDPDSNPGPGGWFGLDPDDSTTQLIIIILAGVTGTLVVILIVAIVYLRHCRHKHQSGTKNGTLPSTKDYQAAAGSNLGQTTFVSNVAYEASLSRDLGMTYDMSSDFKVDDYDLNCAMDGCGQTLNQYDVIHGSPPSYHHDSSLSKSRVNCRSPCCELWKAPCNSLNGRNPDKFVSLPAPALRSDLWNSMEGSYKTCGCNGKASLHSPAHRNTAAAAAAPATAAAYPAAAAANFTAATTVRCNETEMDTGSACTTNLSNCDSGKGHSEEDDPSTIPPSSASRKPLVSSSPISPAKHSASTWCPKMELLGDTPEGYYSNQLALTTFKPPHGKISEGGSLGHRSGTWQHPSAFSTRSPSRQHLQGRYGRSMEDIKGSKSNAFRAPRETSEERGRHFERGSGEEESQIWLPRHAAQSSNPAASATRKPPSGASGRRRQGPALQRPGLEVDIDEMSETAPMSKGFSLEHPSTYAHGV